jgi:acid phosphatase type 7
MKKETTLLAILFGLSACDQGLLPGGEPGGEPGGDPGGEPGGDPGGEPAALCPDFSIPIDTNLRRNPYLSFVGGAEVISFTVLGTDTTPAKVEVIPAAGGDPVVVESSAELFTDGQTGQGFDYVQHQARVPGLPAGGSFCYNISAGDTALAQGVRFSTPSPKSDTSTSFFAIGDWGDSDTSADDVRDQMAEELAARPAELLISMGDNAYSAGAFSEIEEYVHDRYRNIFPSLPYFPSHGNHDYGTDANGPSLAVYALPENALREGDKERYYSFDWGDVHFVAVDTENPLDQISDAATDDMADWLAQDLAATDRTWKVVYFHKPPFSSGSHGNDTNVQERLVPIFEQQKVDLVLSGHDHNYERTIPINGITYVVAGGGGTSLRDVGSSDFTAIAKSIHHFLRVDVEGCKLTSRAIGTDGATVDQFTLDKCGAQ